MCLIQDDSRTYRGNGNGNGNGNMPKISELQLFFCQALKCEHSDLLASSDELQPWQVKVAGRQTATFTADLPTFYTV